jgi:hypothetical protein
MEIFRTLHHINGEGRACVGKGNRCIMAHAERWLFSILFSIAFVFSVVFFGAYLHHIKIYGESEGKINFPIFKSLYSNVYGRAIGSQHVTLFGETSVLQTTTPGGSSYMPMAPLPLSFDDASFADRRNFTYYLCHDPGYAASLPMPDRARLLRLCNIERSKQVALYRNNPVSITFSAAWNPFFMVMVVLFLYASWLLLLWDCSDYTEGIMGYFNNYKIGIYAFWQLWILVVVLFSAIFQVDNAVIPRNNIVFALVLIAATIVQQIITMRRCSKEQIQGEGAMFDGINLIACIRNMDTIFTDHEARKGWMYATESYANYRVINVILSSQIFLFPTLILSLYAIALNHAVEWSFQAAFVRSVLLIMGLLLLNYRRINPIRTHYKMQEEIAMVVKSNARFGIMPTRLGPNPSAPSFDDLDGNPPKATLLDDEKSSSQVQETSSFTINYSMDTILVFVVFLLLWINQIVYDVILLKPAESTKFLAWAGYFLNFPIVASILLVNYFTTTHNRWVVLLNAFIFSFAILISSAIVFFDVVTGLDKTHCTFNQPQNFFCGNAANHNLNLPAYLNPVAINTTSFAEVYSGMASSLTFLIASS